MSFAAAVFRVNVGTRRQRKRSVPGCPLFRRLVCRLIFVRSRRMLIEPSKPRYTISSEGGVTTIACPPRRNWLILLFLIAWLGGWTVGGMGAFTQVTKPGDHQAFMLFWLMGWAVAEI